MDRENFKRELQKLINCHSIENGSNTPDFILADYLMACLEGFERANQQREIWYGRNTTPSFKPAPTSIAVTPVDEAYVRERYPHVAEDLAANCLGEIVAYIESGNIKITTEDAANIRTIVGKYFPKYDARKLTH